MMQRMLAIWSMVLPFLIQLEHLEVHGSRTVEAWLGEFWAFLCWSVRWVQSCGHLNILWHWPSLGLEWKLTFSRSVATAKFSKLIASSFRILNSSAGIPWIPLALFVVILPKAHLTLHARMSGSRWVTTPSWLSGSLRPFLYSSVYFCHFFLVSSASVRSVYT